MLRHPMLHDFTRLSIKHHNSPLLKSDLGFVGVMINDQISPVQALQQLKENWVRRAPLHATIGQPPTLRADFRI